MPAKKMSDQELVKKYQEGDVLSFNTLVQRHKNRVYTYIFTIVKNHRLAEDIFQETFVKVIKSLQKKKYEERGTFLSWVLRIAHNLIIDYYRKNKAASVISNEDSELDLFNNPRFSDDNAEERIINSQIKEDIKALLNLLPTEQKQVVLLRHYWRMSFKEIAEVTGVSINTALGRMRYALINLRKIIQEKNITLRV